MIDSAQASHDSQKYDPDGAFMRSLRDNFGEFHWSTANDDHGYPCNSFEDVKIEFTYRGSDGTEIGPETVARFRELAEAANRTADQLARELGIEAPIEELPEEAQAIADAIQPTLGKWASVSMEGFSDNPSACILVKAIRNIGRDGDGASTDDAVDFLTELGGKCLMAAQAISGSPDPVYLSHRGRYEFTVPGTEFVELAAVDCEDEQEARQKAALALAIIRQGQQNEARTRPMEAPKRSVLEPCGTAFHEFAVDTGHEFEEVRIMVANETRLENSVRIANDFIQWLRDSDAVVTDGRQIPIEATEAA